MFWSRDFCQCGAPTRQSCALASCVRWWRGPGLWERSRGGGWPEAQSGRTHSLPGQGNKSDKIQKSFHYQFTVALAVWCWKAWKGNILEARIDIREVCHGHSSKVAIFTFNISKKVLLFQLLIKLILYQMKNLLLCTLYVDKLC